MRKLILLTALILFAVGTVAATPTTHIWGPSTDIQPYMKWHITSDIYLPMETLPGGAMIPPVTNLGITVGVLNNPKYGLELGIDHKAGLGALDNKPLYFNVKFGLTEESFGQAMPAVALGMYDFGSEADVTDFNLLYLKAAKTLKAGGTDFGRCSVGFFSGNDKLLLDGAGEKDNSGLMIAWERTLTEVSDKLWICAEYMGTESAYGTVNFGAAWKFADNVGVLVGYDIPNNSNLPATATVQVDIDF